MAKKPPPHHEFRRIAEDIVNLIHEQMRKGEEVDVVALLIDRFNATFGYKMDRKEAMNALLVAIAVHIKAAEEYQNSYLQ